MPRLLTVRALSVCLAFTMLTSACQGNIGDDPSAPPPSGSTGAGGGELPCGETGEVIVFFETTCAASGACHQSGGTFPALDREGFVDLLDQESRINGTTLIAPGAPEDSFLYKKMAGTQGQNEGVLMPVGAGVPSEQLELIESWILNGAPTECDEELPPSPHDPDPNTLDPEALFTCEDPIAPRSSPARLRRIGREEFTHQVSRRLDGAYSDVRDNPLLPPAGSGYSTYTDGVGLDTDTLDILTLSLPEASRMWRRNQGNNFSFQNSQLHSDLSCIFSDISPSQACLDDYITMLLERGSLHRRATAEEFNALQTLLTLGIAGESSIADRDVTLGLVAETALLSAEALFRSEVGVAQDDGRRRLTDDELALALGHTLHTHPPGSLKSNHAAGFFPDDPDAGRGDEGWMAAIREAAQDGTIQQPEKRRQLVRRYAAGLDPLRHDVYPDFNHPSHPTAIENRGEYWMAPQFVRFFREWLDYSGADTSFKDTPTATSPYETAPYGDEGFHDLQARAVGPDEALLAEHLDDTIARIVVETDIGTGDVFTELMTSRQWHVPATGDYTTDCTTGCTQVGFGCSHFGDCRNVNGRADAALPLAFGIETPIPKTRAARWATVSASERLGVLTHPAWLAAHGGNFEDDASLVLRGKWLREHLLCQTVGALSMVQVEAQLGPSAPDLSARERVAAAMKTECMACHSLMNSLGVSFELYNHAGFIRDNDHGGPPDGSTDIDNIPTHFGENLNGTYDSPLALVQALATARLARVSFVRHAFRFFMGRDETLADACTLVEMENALDETGSFVVMVEALVASDTFAYRHSEN